MRAYGSCFQSVIHFFDPGVLSVCTDTDVLKSMPKIYKYNRYIYRIQ